MRRFFPAAFYLAGRFCISYFRRHSDMDDGGAHAHSDDADEGLNVFFLGSAKQRCRPNGSMGMMIPHDFGSPVKAANQQLPHLDGAADNEIFSPAHLTDLFSNA